MGKPANKRSFEELLAFSRAAEPLFNAAYREVFGEALQSIARTEAVELQKRGIDVVLRLTDGNNVFIDEKVERRDTGNFFIESSVGQRNPLGWISKTTECHYIVYGFVDTGKVYFLPMALLRVVFEERRKEWKRRKLERTFNHSGVKTTGFIPPQEEVMEHLCSKLRGVTIPKGWTAWPSSQPGKKDPAATEVWTKPEETTPEWSSPSAPAASSSSSAPPSLQRRPLGFS